MPIKSDDANITIEFGWQSDETEEVLYVKHYVESGVPTISVSDDQKEWYNFPAAFFKEVTEFLAQQKVFKPAAKTNFRTSHDPAPHTAQSSTLGVIGGVAPTPSSSGLPVPQIDGASAEPAGQSVSASETAPIQSFAGIEALAQNTSTANPGKKPKKNELDAEIIDRPVIRGADEDLSKKLRPQANTGKSFRRLDD